MAQSNYMETRPESQVGSGLLPAVALGGPPHSGKSVLAYSLTQALRNRNVPHYLLRAYPPDYEGDWFLASEPEQVRHLRIKGARSEAWLPPLKRDLARRHLPLLVDLGGLPTPEQETLLDECTHALLLTPDVAAREVWSRRMRERNLILLADLHSDLHGENRIEVAEPVLRGTLAGLRRGHSAQGPAFDALVECLARLFTDLPLDLRRRHLEQAPAELGIDLERLAEALGSDPPTWRPEDLPAVLDYLPQGVPLAIYGRGPNWLCAALAAHAGPAPFHLFSVTQGWIAAPDLQRGSLAAQDLCTVETTFRPGATRLEYRLHEVYIDVADAAVLPAPPPVAGGLILSGKLPQWLWAALVRSARADWIAVYQPQLRGAVVVAGNAPPPGTLLPDPG